MPRPLLVTFDTEPKTQTTQPKPKHHFKRIIRANLINFTSEKDLRLGLHSYSRAARCGEEVRWSHRGRGPPALKGDAPRMGNPMGGMRSARPSGDPTNRSGRPSTRLGLWGCGEGVTSHLFNLEFKPPRLDGELLPTLHELHSYLYKLLKPIVYQPIVDILTNLPEPYEA